jgi:hypothetical protein
MVHESETDHNLPSSVWYAPKCIDRVKKIARRMSASVSGCWSVGASQPRLRKASGLRGWCMLWTIVMGDVYKILQKG